MDVSPQSWDYLYVEYTSSRDQQVVVAVNDDVSIAGRNLVAYSSDLGTNGWELVSAVPGTRITAKNAVSLSDLYHGNTSNMLSVTVLIFKRPMSSADKQSRIDSKEQFRMAMQSEAGQLLSYLRSNGVEFLITRDGNLDTRGTKLKNDTVDKVRRLAPEIIRIIKMEQQFK